ncbi:helix-turn-helix domain-containing protein [Spelaeicoccus albus]|uniref:Transcriptional regulator with XRE-family HTH domain n=1 Tax=Spelaeicoccus albus TaxID=1280376 RepID=A0A7Z0AAA8_9MICO|nr:XRE family transcriptional regulator [Spelaeicoccus albus]NYI66245.1 transcriptional regulator with XRE-family HTH domain [Spelaeicoccus albus]
MTTDSKSRLDAIGRALRRERERARLSLSELARKAGVAKSTLSQLESGGGNPSVETLWALCIALDIQISVLFDAPKPRVQVIRAGDGPELQSDQAEYRATLLSACPPLARRDVFRLTAEPGASRQADPHAQGVVEHVVLGTGRALVGIASDPVELEPGDYISYPGDVAHTFQALERGTSAVLVSEHTR